MLVIKTVNSWLFGRSSEFHTHRSLENCVALLSERHETRNWLYPLKVQIEQIDPRTYIFRLRKQVIFSRGPFPIYGEVIGSFAGEDETITKISYETRFSSIVYFELAAVALLVLVALTTSLQLGLIGVFLILLLVMGCIGERERLVRLLRTTLLA